jgi:hypothetical protein
MAKLKKQMLSRGYTGRPVAGDLWNATAQVASESAARKGFGFKKPPGLPAHTGIGQLAKRTAAAKAAGQKHTGLGQKLKRKMAKYHPDAKNVNYY